MADEDSSGDDLVERALANARAEAAEWKRKLRAGLRRDLRKQKEELGLRPRRTSFADAEREALADEERAEEELGTADADEETINE